MSGSLKNEKVQIKFEDGLKFLQTTDLKFDVIITDSSDPVGPAESLFGNVYYDAVNRCLDSGGVTCSQAENIWLDIEITKSIVQMCKERFKNVAYASVQVPTYPFGQIGFVMASKDIARTFDRAVLSHPFRVEALPQCKYYNKHIHDASFALPTFALDKLDLHSQVTQWPESWVGEKWSTSILVAGIWALELTNWIVFIENRYLLEWDELKE